MKEIKRPHSAQKTLRVTCLVLADLILINLSAFLALYIRFEFDLGQLRATAFLHDMLVYAGINTVCTIVIFRILNLYNSLWEFASVPELLRIAMGCLLSSVTYMVGMFMLQLAMPRSFPVMYMLILCLLCGSLRFAYRGVRRTRAGLRSRGEKRTMLIGGGQAGAIALREFQTSPRSENKVVCIIDDAPEKYGSYLRGVKIVGGRDVIPAMADCVVLPSYHEGMSNVLLEAAASGRPLITSDISGCREAVEPGVSGYLCPARDADALYAAMRRFLELPPAQRAAMGAASHDWIARNFNKKAVVAETVAALL